MGAKWTHQKGFTHTKTTINLICFGRILTLLFLQLEKEIKAIQENQSTEQIYSEQLLKSRDDIKKLENQLEVVQKRCGEAMSENTNLRGSIDHLLLER